MADAQRTDSRLLAWLALGGTVAYAAIDTALLFLRPQFSFLHNAESDYGSRGSWAWVMDANFLVRCLLSLAAVGAIAVAWRGAATTAKLQWGLGRC